MAEVQPNVRGGHVQWPTKRTEAGKSGATSSPSSRSRSKGPPPREQGSGPIGTSGWIKPAILTTRIGRQPTNSDRLPGTTGENYGTQKEAQQASASWQRPLGRPWWGD